MDLKKALVLVYERDCTAQLAETSGADTAYVRKEEPSLFSRIRRRIDYGFGARELYGREVVVLFECNHPLEVIKRIRKYNTHCRIIYRFWNSIVPELELTMGGSKDMPPFRRWRKERKRRKLDEEFSRFVSAEERSRYGYELVSFDELDCKKYGLSYDRQVAFEIKGIERGSPDSDIFFCGKDKGRLPLLRRLKEALAPMGVRCRLMVRPDSRTRYGDADREYMMAREISYPEYVREAMRSRCILGLVQKGQGGMTWRPLEALFYGKKLITNFARIRDCGFYDPDNIFILEDDRFDGIVDFLRRDGKKIPDEVRKEYTFDRWIERILSSS